MPASAYVLQGQEFVRVKRTLKTDPSVLTFGDDCGAGSAAVFDVGVKAIALGPESSFDQYTIVYYNPTNGLQVELGKIAEGRPWIARLDAFMNQDIGSLAQPGKLFVVPANNWNVSDFSASFTKLLIAPTIDIIGYMTNEILSLGAIARAPEFVDAAIELDAGVMVNYAVLPFLGRSEFDLRLYGDGTFTNLTYQVDLQTRGNFNVTISKTLVASTAWNGTTDEIIHYEKTANGRFDYVLVNFIGAAGFAGNDPQSHNNGGARIYYEAR